jgi:hypothetical protein
MAQWIDGPIVKAKGLNVNGTLVDMVHAFVSYFGLPNGTEPVVGTPFACRLVVGVDNPPVGNVPTINGVFLPANVSLLTQSSPQCLLQNTSGTQTDVTTDPAADCRLSRPALQNGALSLGDRPIPSFRIFIITFMVVANAPVSGQKIRGYVGSQYGDLVPEVTLRTASQPAPPPNAGRIAYKAYPFFPVVESIETMRFDGTDVRRLVSSDLTNDMHVGNPVWSPDGSRLIFDSYRPLPGAPTSYAVHSYVMNSDGTNQQRLIQSGPLSTMTCMAPRLSSDGALMVLSASSPGLTTQFPGPFWSMWTMNSDGTGQVQHTDEANALYPVWIGPRALACIVEHRDILTMNTDESDVSRFNLNSDWIRSDLASHRSHNILAFTAKRVGNFDDEEIHLWDRSAGERSIGKGRYPTFSPDGLWVAYSKRTIQPNGTPIVELFRKDLSGERETLISSTWTDYNDWSSV